MDIDRIIRFKRIAEIVFYLPQEILQIADNELSRIKILSNSDIEKLIAGATNKLTKDLITFLIYTGCRKGEALNLKWDDMDLQNDVIAIKGTKTKYDRYIPVSKPLKELLSGIKKEKVLVDNLSTAKKGSCLYVNSSDIRRRR
ncbi:MAG: tyrosine-type recombinase/integrase [Deltaproteobacteria bacterium]|nr:tyrosine-type recombinase/integrase [Deltaproteobacteria bacterium]